MQSDLTYASIASDRTLLLPSQKLFEKVVSCLDEGRKPNDEGDGGASIRPLSFVIRQSDRAFQTGSQLRRYLHRGLSPYTIAYYDMACSGSLRSPTE